MPLPGYRNYQTLINLVPGATPAAFQNAPVDTPGRALTTNINGTPRNNNNTLTDGAVNINIWLPHHVAYVQPVETIETVNISTNSFDAEQGMAGGAAITITTKSGTNELHGVAYWFHTNNRLMNAPYFRAATFRMPKTTRNIAGGTLGGPIKKDKLFYFFSYERTDEATGQSGNFSVAPAEFREGDFSKWVNYARVYDPATAPPDQAANRQPFPGNIVPKSRWNPIFSNIYSKMPLPNQISPTDPNNLQGNYLAQGLMTLIRNQYDFKSNWNATSKLMVWGKYSRMDAPVQGTYPFGELGGAALGTEGIGDTTTQLVTAGHTYTFSPTFYMDGVFGYTRMDQEVTIPGMGRNVGLDEWKIPGTNGGRQYANDPRYGGLPQITGFGFSYIGVGATWAPAVPQGAQLHLSDQLLQDQRRARVPLGLRAAPAGAEPLAARDGQPARSHQLRGRHHQHSGPGGSGAQRLRRGTAGPGFQLLEVDPVLRNENPRVAAGLVLPRPLAGQPAAHAQPRPPL